MTPVFLALELPAGYQVIETTKADAKSVITGHPPHTKETRLRTYDLRHNDEIVGDFHAYPVQIDNGTITTEWAGRVTKGFPSNTAYSGGYSTRESVVQSLLLVHASTNKKPEPRFTFSIRQNKAKEYVGYFSYNGECIFWTEGYASRRSALNAIESLIKAVKGDDFKIEHET